MSTSKRSSKMTGYWLASVASMVCTVIGLALFVKVFFFGFAYERPVNEQRVRDLALMVSALCFAFSAVFAFIAGEIDKKPYFKYVFLGTGLGLLTYVLVGLVVNTYARFEMYTQYKLTPLYQEDLKKEAEESQRRFVRVKCDYLYAVASAPDRSLPYVHYMDIEALERLSADAAELYKKWCPEQK